MSTTWVICDIDAKKQDQYQVTYNTDTNAVKGTLIQTWVVACQPTVPPTVQSNPVDAASAAVIGGNSLPQAAGTVTYSGFDFTVTRLMPKRIGPTSFEVQVQAELDYQPTKTGKFNVTIAVDGQVSKQDAYYDSSTPPKAIVNSAGCSFDPSIPYEIYDEVFDISYSTTSDQSAAFAGVRGQVNNSSISFAIQGISRSFSERQLKCIGAKQTADLPLAGGTPTFKCNVRFGSRTDTWITKVLDQGYYTLDDTTNELVAIKDKWGDNVNAPAQLDGAGDELTPGDDPVFLTFKIETEADFAAIFTGLA